MKRLRIVLPVCAMFMAAAALAGPAGGGMGNSSWPIVTPAGQTGPDAVRIPANLSYKTRMILELRTEALRMQREDGGTLTSEHLAYLQAKLDRIQAHPS